jgi:hypothetical protein
MFIIMYIHIYERSWHCVSEFINTSNPLVHLILFYDYAFEPRVNANKVN